MEVKYSVFGEIVKPRQNKCLEASNMAHDLLISQIHEYL